jgi:hypothetical protein
MPVSHMIYVQVTEIKLFVEEGFGYDYNFVIGHGDTIRTDTNSNTSLLSFDKFALCNVPVLRDLVYTPGHRSSAVPIYRN